jgi:galactose mutarotase-like enzyme
MTGLVQIASTHLAVEIAPDGAEMRSLRTASGRDLLWRADARWWDAVSPLLFPVIGRLPEAGIRIGGRRYQLPMHGIARGRRFDPVATAPDRASWRLVDDEATRAVYPFAFELLVDYAVEAATLTIAATMRNTGTATMPASFGFHPGFRWPLAGLGDKNDYRVRFAEPETGPVWRASGGFMLPDQVASPMHDRDFDLREAEFTTGAVIFGRLRSRSVTYCYGQRPLLTVGFEGCANLALWSRTGGGFVCIEPWNGLPQTAAFDGELADRPDMIALDPGRDTTTTMRIAVDDRMCM